VEEAGAKVIPVQLDSNGELTGCCIRSSCSREVKSLFLLLLQGSLERAASKSRIARWLKHALTTGRIPPTDLPDILSKLALRSVMIEGGSRILSAFLHSEPRSDGSPVVDNIIITVAPMFIGEGVGVVPDVSSLTCSWA